MYKVVVSSSHLTSEPSLNKLYYKVQVDFIFFSVAAGFSFYLVIFLKNKRESSRIKFRGPCVKCRCSAYKMERWMAQNTLLECTHH